MKKLNKILIKPEKLIKAEELRNLRGGDGSYKCYHAHFDGGCIGFITYINTASCQMAAEVCYDLYGGFCIEGC